MVERPSGHIVRMYFTRQIEKKLEQAWASAPRMRTNEIARASCGVQTEPVSKRATVPDRYKSSIRLPNLEWQTGQPSFTFANE